MSSTEFPPVRFGIIGLGNMGSHHLRALLRGQIQGGTLGAVCDIDPAARDRARTACEAAGSAAPVFDSHTQLLQSATCEAVLIATPHYSHCPIAMDAFASGTHVMCEKPLAVGVQAARELIDAYQGRFAHLKFGIMYQQRTQPIYQTLRRLILGGEIGALRRITWIVTDWFRPDCYYASSAWRATWAGEGGGVTINQCPHNFDLLQWFTGLMPTRVTAVATIGKTHPIEVEDELSAIFEFPGGATGHFITSTGEGPGGNHLDIAGDRGRLIVENGRITFHRTLESVEHISRSTDRPFHNVETWKCEIPIPTDAGHPHEQVNAAFARAIRQGTPLVADGVDGVRGLEIGNAMLMAGLTRTPVELPLDGPAFNRFILDMKARHGGKKTLSGGSAAPADLSGSFH